MSTNKVTIAIISLYNIQLPHALGFAIFHKLKNVYGSQTTANCRPSNNLTPPVMPRSVYA